METPEHVRSDQAVAFTADHLQGRPRVLHVARAASSVEPRLAGLGFGVTTTDDAELADITESFDAVVASHVLSSVLSLEETIRHASRLLAPNGRLIVDDLDLAAPDTITLRWFHDVVELLSVAGIYAEDRVHPRHAEPLVRWREGMQRDGILHSGTAMRVAISAHFMIRELRRVEYFYHHISHGLAADPRGAAITSHLRGVERRLIANDTLMPIGLRIVADRAQR